MAPWHGFVPEVKHWTIKEVAGEGRERKKGKEKNLKKTNETRKKKKE